jgi:hypothetical protein
MPTIIGNSVIRNSGAVTGPQGPQGPRGPQGPTGNFGPTGPTGSTGVYIFGVTKINGALVFNLSDNISIYTNKGFTGPTGDYSNTTGITHVSPGIVSIFSQTVSGKTLQFRGICGQNGVSVGFNSDRTGVNVNINGLATTGVLGSTLPNYVLYTTNNFSATRSKIGVTGSVLSFGVTATNGATSSGVGVYSNFKENLYPIPAFGRTQNPATISTNDVITSASSGGLSINLNKYSSYLLQTPIGITAFTTENNSNVLQSYTLFINGENVWNLPNNVYFEKSEKGIEKYDFLPGMNIVHMWTTNGGTTFNATIVERGIASTQAPFYFYDSVGSCCFDSGQSCQEYITPSECQDLGGVFNPLKTCLDTCGNFGACCLNGTCYENIEEQVCTGFGGDFKGGLCSPGLCPPLIGTGACCQIYGNCVDGVEESQCDSRYFNPNTTCGEISTTCGPITLGTCGDPAECIVYPNRTKSNCDALVAAGQSSLRFYPNVDTVNPWPGCVTGRCCSSDATVTPPTFACGLFTDKFSCGILGNGSQKSSTWIAGLDVCSDCVNTCLNPADPATCLGACCYDANGDGVNDCVSTTKSGCDALFGVWRQGIPCASDICGNYLVESAGACCVDGVCQIATQTVCVGLGGDYKGDNVPCSAGLCTDSYNYSFTLEENDGSPLSFPILDITTSPYTKSFKIRVATTNPSSNSFKLVLPATITHPTIGTAQYTISRSGTNTTPLSNGDTVDVTISIPVATGTAVVGIEPAILLVQLVNNSGVSVHTGNINVHTGYVASVARGCVSCTNPTPNKFKIQLEGTIKRYCLDCQKYEPVSKTYRPYPVKEQKVFANVCVDLNASIACGFGITLDAVTYGPIADTWDCRYSATEETGISNPCARGCPHLEYGSSFWEGSKRGLAGTQADTCSAISTNCSADPNTTTTSHTGAISLATGFTAGNYWRNRYAKLGLGCSNVAPTKNITAKGEVKTYTGTACPTLTATLDPYYSQLEWSPDVYAKLGYYTSIVSGSPVAFTASGLKLRLVNIGNRLLSLRAPDTQKMALNPNKQNQSITINNDAASYPVCTGQEITNITNTGKGIFTYVPQAGKTVKYLLFVNKKSHLTGITYDPYRTDTVTSIATSAQTSGRGCKATYSLAVVRWVVNSNGSLDIINSASTNFLSGKPQFPWEGKGNKLSLFRTVTNNDLSLQPLLGRSGSGAGGADPVDAGYPCPLWDSMLIGEINPGTDLDGSGNLIFNPVSDYSFKNEDVLCDAMNTGVRYEPNIDNYWKYFSNTKPKYTPFTNNQTGYDYAYKFRTLYFNAVECNPGSKPATQTGLVDYGYSCCPEQDQYSYTSCFCRDANSKRPLSILSKIYSEKSTYKANKTSNELTYYAVDGFNSTLGINETTHIIKNIVCTTTSGCSAVNKTVELNTGNVYTTAPTMFSSLKTVTPIISINSNVSSVKSPNWLNSPTQKYSLQNIVYITGSNFGPTEIPQSYYGDVPLHAVEYTIDKKLDGTPLIPAITMAPVVTITPGSGSVAISVTPNVIKENTLEVGWLSGSVSVSAWVINPDYENVTQNNAVASTSGTWNTSGSWDSSLSLPTISSGLPGVKTIGGVQYWTVVVLIRANVSINNQFGNQITESTESVARSRVYTKILQGDVRIGGGAQTLTDNDSVIASANQLISEPIITNKQTNPVVNKIINNACVSIDCTGSELLCDQLRNC